MAKLSPVFNDTQFDDSGNLLVGGLIYSFVAGSATPLATYTTSDGNIPQTNPIVLNARGEVASPIWLADGNAYKLRLFDSNNNFIREFDNVTGIGDNSVVIDQWQSTNISPTYVSATQFTVPGDQTSNFSVGRRIKATVTAGTVYGTITSSVFTTLTTVTVSLDSGALDTGLSSVLLGIITPDNTSLPNISDLVFRLFNVLDKTKKLAFNLAGITTATTRTLTVQDKDGTIALTSDITTAIGNLPPVRQTVFSGPVDTSGLPAFGGATGSATVTAAGTLVATAAFSSANRVGSILNPSWTGLSTNGTMYLYLDIAADGTCTTGSTTLPPLYRWGGADITTNNQFTFNIQEMTGKVGNGATAAQTYRVFVGEVTVAGGVVTVITWYALMGRYIGQWTATLPGVGTTVAASHNIGVANIAASQQVKPKPLFEIECTTADIGFVIGDNLQNLTTSATGAVVNIMPTIQGNLVFIKTGASTAFISTNAGAAAGLTAASWKYRFRVERGW